MCCVHHETRITSDIAAVRQAIDVVGHSALLLVDSISGLASVDYEHDKWGADVTVSGSQKGLMMPPGLGFNALSDRALEAAKHGGSQRSYWDWQEMLASTLRLFSIHASHYFALWLKRSDCNAGGRRPR